MPTVNKNLKALTEEDVKRISEEYLLGHRNMEPRYGFRLKGFNHVREKFGLEPLTEEMSRNYRLDFIRSHYTQDEIEKEITECLRSVRVGDDRWTGIDVLGCRFGREYAKLFKELLGASLYRKVSEDMRQRKLKETQENLYGGVGLAGDAAKQKARQTVEDRYGVGNVMQSPEIKERLAVTNMLRYGSASPFGNADVKAKASDVKTRNMQEAVLLFKKTGAVTRAAFRQSPFEYAAFLALAKRFGSDDVFWQYGIHPSDKRYPYNCDFYIRSMDLFIEINAHYSHGGHWFDPNDRGDVNRLNQLKSGTQKMKDAAKEWSVRDPEKRETARRNGLKYLVFWDERQVLSNGMKVPRLSDFYEWLIRYDADYGRFVSDHPENTY